MSPNRFEAFSDGVLAIIITIMVLELKVPHGPELAELRPLVPVFFAYAMSFVYVGIYWNNHHHMVKLAGAIDGSVMWANLHLLFWLSLTPFVSGWVGEHPDDAWPAACYGIVLMASAIAWWILQTRFLCLVGRDSDLARALRSDWKGKVSPILYLAGIGLAFVHSWISFALYALVAAMWLVPDKRFEAELATRPNAEE